MDKGLQILGHYLVAQSQGRSTLHLVGIPLKITTGLGLQEERIVWVRP